MYPIASQVMFEINNSRFSGKLSDNDSNKRRTHQIENILKISHSSVIAESQIGKSSRSHQYSCDQVLFDEVLPKKMTVRVQSDNFINPSDPTLNKFWIKSIRVADDIPGANVLLHLVDDKIELSTTKFIDANEELLLWFSDEILNVMGISFLMPANIQGQKSYVCLQCYRSYEVPNQLKLHLARNCDHFEESVLWDRLQTELLSRHQKKKIVQSRNFEMMNPYHSAIMHSLPSSSRPFSAFHPVFNQCEPSPSPPASFMPIPNLSPSTQSSLNDSALAAAAHLETIVSNMGTSKQGHLCIYCGKLYSRKYGLKIHIRTHTGFKPLKCRHCFRAFGDPSNLNKHIRLHNQHHDHHQTSQNSLHMLECHICNKSFLKRRDLQRHMQLKHSSHEHLITNSSVSSVDESSMTLLYPSSSPSEEDAAE